MTLFHIVLWCDGKVVTTINVKAETEREALESARLQYPVYTPEITMRREVWEKK